MTRMDLGQPIKKYMRKDPLKVKSDATLGDVVSEMAQNEKDIAVVMDGKQLRGIITSHDLFDALKTYVLGKQLLEQAPGDVSEMRITSVMKGPYTREFMETCGLRGTDVCISLGEDESIEQAVRVMAVSGLDHILIIGGDGVVGTLSDDDLIKAIAN